MPLKVVDANDADVLENLRIDAAAYKGSIYERLFFPNGRSPEMLDLQAKDMIKNAQEDPSMRNIKVIDTDDNDRPIAFARWYIYHGDNVQYMPVDTNNKGVISGTDATGLAIWNDFVRKRRIEYIGGRPHYCKRSRFNQPNLAADLNLDLSNLITDPEHQRRGAGSMLIQWGCEAADNDGVPIFLQASPAGYQTYKRCGFEEAYATDIDLRDLGLDGVHHVRLMGRHFQPGWEKDN